MAIRRNLKERLGMVNANPPAEPQAELRVPDGDRGRQFVQDVATGISAANALLAERNMFEARCKEQEKTIANLRGVATYHQGEARYYRSKLETLTRSQGALMQTIKSIEAQFGLAASTVRLAEAENAQLPAPAPMSMEVLEDFRADVERDLKEVLAEPGQAIMTNGGAPMGPEDTEITELARRLSAATREE